MVKPNLPIIGDIVEYGQDISLVTVASFLPDDITKNPSCILLGKDKLGAYFDMVNGFDIKKSPDPIYMMNRVLEGCDHKFVRLQPRRPNWNITGRHDFDVSSEHIAAISKEGSYALAKSFGIGEEDYVIEGHFIARKNGKPSIMTIGSYGLPFHSKETRLVLSMEHLLPSRGCDGDCQPHWAKQQQLAIAESP